MYTKALKEAAEWAERPCTKCGVVPAMVFHFLCRACTHDNAVRLGVDSLAP